MCICTNNRGGRGHDSVGQCARIMMHGGMNMNQTIRCSVETCRHHSARNLCELESIDVRPNCACHTGKCDESMCGSYDKK